MSQVHLRRRPNAGPPRPAIRLRPAPILEPPFDDELPPGGHLGQRTDQRAEQLRLDLRGGTPATGGCRNGHVADGAADGRGTVRLAAGPGATPTGGSPECWHAARRFIGVCVEILNGYRTAGQVRPFVSPAHAVDVIEQLGMARERVTALSRRASRTDRPGRRAPRCGPPRGDPRRREPVRLCALKVCEPRCGVAEAAAVLHTGGRAWALAVRLERRRGKWLCTAARTI